MNASLQRKLTAERRMERAFRIIGWTVFTLLVSGLGFMVWLGVQLYRLVTHGPY